MVLSISIAKPLLWDLPYYGRETKVGTLLALPVVSADTLRGVLVAKKVETQALTGDEPGLLEGFADLRGAAARPGGPPSAGRWLVLHGQPVDAVM